MTSHSTTGIPPIDRWNNGFLPQLPESPEVLDLLLLTIHKTRKVQRDGIRFQGMRYIAPSLAGFVGEQITIRYDPRYTQWHEELIGENAVDEVSAKIKKVIKNCKGAFLTAPVTNTPKTIKTEIIRRTSAYGMTLAKAKMERDLYKIATQANQLCPLVIIDEADRLNINALEEVRSL